jgi:hypothetical protein
VSALLSARIGSGLSEDDALAAQTPRPGLSLPLPTAPSASGAPIAAYGQAENPELVDCQVSDRCALRVRHGLFGTEIVRGTEDRPIAEIGFRATPLGELFARSDQAAHDFDRFGTNHRRASWMSVLGGVELVGALVARSQGEDDRAMALSISGVAIEVVAMIFRTRADEHLSRAIWWYNELPSDGGGR